VLFHYDGAKVEYTDGAIREIARRAKARGTGARALRSIMEGMMLDIMYDLPENDAGRTYTITEEIVEGKKSLFGPDAT
jgi:ATP-dependent Clp protease ATP-binding subunit ClpX